MDIKTESKTVIEIAAHYHDGKLKTAPCELYEWWGDEICQEINFSEITRDIKLAEGEYKVTITFEKVNE